MDSGRKTLFRRIAGIVQTLLLIALCYLGFTLIQTLDRLHTSNVKLAAALENRKHLPHAGTHSSASGAAPAANAEYFAPEAKTGGRLRSAISADAPHFNPLTVNEATARNILSLCSAPLAERDWADPTKFKPMLAESWEISPDHLTYKIKLRRNAMWQSYRHPDSGMEIPAREVVADDFVFALEAIRNPDVDCAFLRNYYKDLVSIKANGKYELTVSWGKKYYGSLSSTLSLTPLPRDYYCSEGVFDGKKFNNDHRRNRTIISCGPYIMDSWDKDRRIKLRRNPGYFGIPLGIAPPLAERSFEVIKHPNTQLQALLGNQLDMLSLTAEQWMRRTDGRPFKDGSISRYRYNGQGYSYIGYNADHHCFKDAATRRALTLLIDREKILKEISHSLGSIANGPFAPGTPYTDPELRPHTRRPEAAKALLKQAGWQDRDGDGILERDGHPFCFTMLQISGSSSQARILPMIKEYFAAAGIDMRLQTVEWSVYLERLKSRNFEACFLGWTGSLDPDLYQIFHSSQIDGGDNFVGYRNPEVDRLIEALREEFDMKKRVEICREIERHLHHDQPYTFMFYPDQLTALNSKYKNVRLFPVSGLIPLAFYLD